MTIRPGGGADVKAVMRLEGVAVGAPRWAEADYLAAVELQEGAVRRCLLVAETEGRLVGFAVGKVAKVGDETLAELESVAVDPGERRRGVGQALCRAVLAWGREMGAERMELEVRAGSVAIGLYAGLGFAETGRRRGYYRDPAADAVLMQIDLGR